MQQIPLTLQQISQLLFPDYHTGLEEANALRMRHVMDSFDCCAIPKWLAVQIAEQPDHENTFKIIYLAGEHPILWTREAWMKSRDRRAGIITKAREQMREQTERTRYEQQVYEFVTKLAERIVNNWFPGMKKGHLRASFQSTIARKNYDLARFRAVLDESFAAEVILTCWVNEPEKPTYDNATSQGRGQEAPTIEEVVGADEHQAREEHCAPPLEDRSNRDEDRGDSGAGETGFASLHEGEDSAGSQAEPDSAR
jgi:hypothetical protein